METGSRAGGLHVTERELELLALAEEVERLSGLLAAERAARTTHPHPANAGIGASAGPGAGNGAGAVRAPPHPSEFTAPGLVSSENLRTAGHSATASSMQLRSEGKSAGVTMQDGGRGDLNERGQAAAAHAGISGAAASGQAPSAGEKLPAGLQDTAPPRAENGGATAAPGDRERVYAGSEQARGDAEVPGGTTRVSNRELAGSGRIGGEAMAPRRNSGGPAEAAGRRQAAATAKPRGFSLWAYITGADRLPAAKGGLAAY